MIRRCMFSQYRSGLARFKFPLYVSFQQEIWCEDSETFPSHGTLGLPLDLTTPSALPPGRPETVCISDPVVTKLSPYQEGR